MTNERVSELFCDIKLNLPNASLLYSVDDCLIPELVQPLREAAVTFMLQPGNAEKTMDELVLPFLEALQINGAEFKQKIEEETRDQHLSEQWRNQRLGRITASIIHDVMTKTESIIANRRKSVSPKYSPLVDKIVNGNPDIGIDPVKWGKLHEDDAIKTFMAEEATKEMWLTGED